MGDLDLALYKKGCKKTNIPKETFMRIKTNNPDADNNRESIIDGTCVWLYIKTSNNINKVN